MSLADSGSDAAQQQAGTGAIEKQDASLPDASAADSGAEVPEPNAACDVCADGFARADSDCSTTCTPLLLMLSSSQGVLSPAFDSRITHYRLELPLLTDSLALAASAPDGSNLSINGTALASAAAYTVNAIPYGESAVMATVQTPAGGAREYAITLTRTGAQRAYLKASNTGSGDGFGYSVAADGDTLVVGAPHEDSSATGVNGNDDDAAAESGAAYVFRRTDAGFVQTAYLKPSTVLVDGHFGWAVTVADDTIAVGAPDKNGGAVYVFTREGETWRASATSYAPVHGDYGQALALHGDTLVVGAPAEDAGATSAGAVYVLKRMGENWESINRLVSPNAQLLGFLGSGVAINGDLIVAGATGESSTTIGSGAAYAWRRESGGNELTLLPRIVAANPGASDVFGDTVAIAGNSLAIGAMWASLGPIESGALYIYDLQGETFSQPAVVSAANAAGMSHFASRVAYQGSVIVAGSPDEDGAGRGVNGALNAEVRDQSGAAYVFVRRDGTFNQLAYLKADAPGAGDQYGSSVAVVGDTLFIGAPSESSHARGIAGDADNDDAPKSGAVYVVR